MLIICFLCTTMTVRPLSSFVYFSSTAKSGGKDEDEDAQHAHTKDSKLTGASNDQAELADFPIIVAIASPSPAIKTLMFLLNLLGHRNGCTRLKGPDDTQNATGQISIDLIRLLPIEYTTSSIMQLINYSEERQRDEMIESLKKVQQLCRVPTSALLARERKLGHFTNTPATPTVAIVTDGLHFSVPPDTFIVPRSDMIKTIGQQNARARNRLGSTESVTSELGQGMALVTWEAHNSRGRGLSWLGAAAAASGLSFSKTLNQEDAAMSFFQANSDAQSLPARLFRTLRKQCATGVLLDPSMSHFPAFPSTGSTQQDALALRREMEHSHGLQRPPGARRIIVPFFGGADDRAAVEFLRRIVLNSGGSVQGLVITFTSGTGSIPGMTVEALSREKAMPMENPTADDENIDSINLKTIYQQEAARVDARFLFHQQDASTAVATVKAMPEELVTGSAAQVEQEKVPNDDPTPAVRTTEAGVVFINLASTPDTLTNPISTMAKVLLPLLDEHQDMVIIGRGKWNQRPKELRLEVERMHSRLAGLSDDLREELRTLGNCLGAVSEGLLVQGLRTCAVVVQAAQQ